MRSLLILFVTLFLVTPTRAEESLAIIVQKSSPLKNVSLDDIKRIYQRIILLDTNGNRWIPLNLPIDHELRRSFSLELFKNTPEEQEQYWNEQYFQGVYPPEVLSSEEAVIRFIEITPGAIGYIHKSHVDKRIKVVTILTMPLHH